MEIGDDADAADAPPPVDAPVGPEPPWWDLAWGSRARMPITNAASSSAPAGLEVALAVDLAALPGATRASLRVVRWDDGAHSWTEIRIRTSSTGPTMFVPWVRGRTLRSPAPSLSLEATEPRP